MWVRQGRAVSFVVVFQPAVPESQGQGHGLFVIGGVMKRSRGEIRVETKKDVGTTRTTRTDRVESHDVMLFRLSPVK